MTPEFCLWRDVIHSIIEDMENDSRKAKSIDDVMKVYRSLERETYSKHFMWCCDWVDIYPQKIRQQLRLRLGKELSRRQKRLVSHQNHQAVKHLAAVTKETFLESGDSSTVENSLEQNQAGQLRWQNILL